jgi:hypothetical protein
VRLPHDLQQSCQLENRLRINGLFENGWPGGKAKSAQNRVHPAKHAGPRGREMIC